MYRVVYDIEYADGSKGHGSHEAGNTLSEARDEVTRMKNRKYTAEELDYAPMYSNFTIEGDDEDEEP